MQGLQKPKIQWRKPNRSRFRAPECGMGLLGIMLVLPCILSAFSSCHKMIEGSFVRGGANVPVPEQALPLLVPAAP